MTVTCHPDLRRLLAVEVNSPGSFSVLGYRIVTEPSQLLQALESELYYRLYSGATSADVGAAVSGDPAESLAFIAALSEANTGTGTWEPGWRIGGSDGPQGGIGGGQGPQDGIDGSQRPRQSPAIRVIRDGITFWAKPEEVRRPASGGVAGEVRAASGSAASGSTAPGQPCSVRVGKEQRHLLYGFYLALGNEHPGDTGPGPGNSGSEPAPLVRLYWHLTPVVAVRYMQDATRRLNEAGIPFETKVVSNPRNYGRRDSGVLYLRQADFGRAVPILREIHQTVQDGLLPEVPLFTKPLAPGLGVAEDPGGGMSFGQSRCHIAALGLLECQRQGLTEPEERLGIIVEAFRAEGLDPEHPYLAPGSADNYQLDPEPRTGG